MISPTVNLHPGELWARFLNISASDPNRIRRGRLLNIVLLGLFLMFLGALVYTLYQDVTGPSDWEMTLTYITTIIMMIGTSIIYFINRSYSSSLAATLFLLLITLTIFFADTPHESIWGRNMIPFVIPIIMASVILLPVASFVVAGLIICISITLAGLENLPINFIGAFAYLGIAWISWLSARTLENALEEARSYMLQLKEAQAQLIRQEKLAALGQISGSIAHELRNPLGAIKNAAFVLDKHWANHPESEPISLAEDLHPAIDIINREVTISEKIINNLLDFTRPKLPIFTWASLNELVEKSLQRVHVPDTVTIKLQLTLAAPKILCDADQLTQVLINLLTNALQAMSDHGTLTLQTVAAQDQVKICISDTGTGISEENMKKLFEPLFTTKAKGMGLGLFICQKILNGHDGSIALKSTPGVGTTVEIVLPIRPNSK